MVSKVASPNLTAEAVAVDANVDAVGGVVVDPQEAHLVERALAVVDRLVGGVHPLALVAEAAGAVEVELRRQAIERRAGPVGGLGDGRRRGVAGRGAGPDGEAGAHAMLMRGEGEAVAAGDARLEQHARR